MKPSVPAVKSMADVTVFSSSQYSEIHQNMWFYERAAALNPGLFKKYLFGLFQVCNILIHTVYAFSFS